MCTHVCMCVCVYVYVCECVCVCVDKSKRDTNIYTIHMLVSNV